MKTVTSVSGGKTSAFVAVHYPSDYNLFALVRIEDEKCKYPDKKIRQMVEDRIQKPFIATAEDDEIIKTMLELEQYMGREIKWVSGDTFEEIIRTKGGWLPNKLHRYCTHWLKIAPMFDWWLHEIGEPVRMQIGFRAGRKEQSRAKKMMGKCNENGLLEFKTTLEKHTTGRHKGLNKWIDIEWQQPAFPLIYDRIYNDHIVGFWKGKPVTFAELNNCAHCFHRTPMLLKLQSIKHPNKIQWAANQEGGPNGYWRADVAYQAIIEHNAQIEMDFNDFGECDSGYCEL